MAKGYKRDSKGRFSGGYGAGALGGKGAYAGRVSGSRSAASRPSSSSPSKLTGRSASAIRSLARSAGAKGGAVARRAATSKRAKRTYLRVGVGTLGGVAAIRGANSTGLTQGRMVAIVAGTVAVSQAVRPTVPTSVARKTGFR